MANAPNYVPNFNFTDFQTSNPSTPLPGNEVDSELTDVGISVNAINANLQLIQRSDGALANAIVGPDQLNPSMNLGVNSFAAWVSGGHNYLTNNGVIVSNAIYYCKVAHASSTSFSGDLALGYWGLIMDFTQFLLGQIATFVTPVSFRNALLNSCGSVAQRGAGGSASFTGISTQTQVMDAWFGWVWSGSGNMTVSQQSGPFTSSDGLNYPFLMRVQRPNGNTSTHTHALVQIVLGLESERLAGQTCNLSFSARKGANFSAGGNLLNVRVETGTVLDEGSTALTGATWTGQAQPLTTTQLLTATLTRYTIPVTIPSNAKEIAVEFYFSPSGTAGTNDYFDITGVQLEVGGPTMHEQIPFDVEVERCLPLCEKSFDYAAAPQQNGSFGAGAFEFPVLQAGATAQRSPECRFRRRKRNASYTLTLYNPGSANAQAKDGTAGDCSSTAIVRAHENGFSISCTGNAGGAIANPIGVHWLADNAL